MKKQLVIIGITLVLLAVGFSGCTNNNTPNGTSNITGPRFAMTVDSATNRLTVVYVNSSLMYKWRDIEIRSEDLNNRHGTFQVFNANGTPIDAVNQTSGAGDTKVSIGDYILISHPTYIGNVTITLIYTPKILLLGTWIINI